MKGNISLKSMKAMIFMIISIFILLAVIVQVMIKINTSVDRSACSTSIAAQKMAHIKGVGFAPEELNCRTRDVVIKGSDEKELKLAIAEEMRGCWKDFGEGKAELFDTESVFCSECAIITFRDEKVVLNRFSDFLVDTRMKGDERTYAEYLTDFRTGNLADILDSSRTQSTQATSVDLIHGDRTYSAVFVYVKGRHVISEWKRKIGTIQVSMIAGLGAGALAGGGSAYLLLVTLGNPFGLLVTGVTVATLSLVAGGVAAYNFMFSFEDPEWMAMMILKERTEDQFVTLGCEYFPSIQQNINKGD